MYFTSGLLSVLDALLDRPMVRVLSGLALVPDVADALLGDTRGAVGRVLRQVQAYEAGDWSHAVASGRELCDGSQASHENILQAVGWAHACNVACTRDD